MSDHGHQGNMQLAQRRDPFGSMWPFGGGDPFARMDAMMVGKVSPLLDLIDTGVDEGGSSPIRCLTQQNKPLAEHGLVAMDK